MLTFILSRSCSSTAWGLVKAHQCSGRRTQHPGVLQNIRAGKCGQPGSWDQALQRVPKPRADALLQAAVIAAAGRAGVRSITTKRRALIAAIIAFRTLRGVSLWAVCICSVTQSGGVILHPAGASQELQPCSALRPRAVRSAAQVMIASLGGFLWFQKPNQSNKPKRRTWKALEALRAESCTPRAGGAAAHPQHGGAGFLRCGH